MSVRQLPPPSSPVLAPDVKRAFVGRLARAFAQIVVNDLATEGLALEVVPPGTAGAAGARKSKTQRRSER